MGSRHTSEWFNTAGRSVKTGLIASVIVSQVMNSNSLVLCTLMSLKFKFSCLYSYNDFCAVDMGCYNTAKL